MQKKFFNGIFEYKNISPTHLNEAMKVISQEIEMPSCVGKSLTQAISNFNKTWFTL